MHPVLGSAVVPVIQDLETAFTSILEATELDEGRPLPSVALTGWDGTLVVFALDEDASPAERTVEVADRVQELVPALLHSAAMSAAWPECPSHPGRHSMRARAGTTDAVWTCPSDAGVAVPIGTRSPQAQRVGFSLAPLAPRPARPDRDEALEPMIAEALAPVLRDLHSTSGPVPRIADSRWDPELQSTAMLWSADGCGAGVGVVRSDSAPQQVVSAADGVQEWAIEDLWRDGRPATWPVCPRHPGTHPLRPDLRDGAPTWCCPVDEVPVAAIGALPPS